MLWIVHCLDAKDAAERRTALTPTHSAHLRTVAARPIVYGPLLSDDGATGVGSMFVIDVPDRATAQRWVETDPFGSGGVWGEVRIHAFGPSANAPVQLPVTGG